MSDMDKERDVDTQREIDDNFGFKAREGRATGEQVRLTPEQDKARKRRNLFIALSLVAFMVAVFLITVVRLSENIASGGAG